MVKNLCFTISFTILRDFTFVCMYIHYLQRLSYFFCLFLFLEKVAIYRHTIITKYYPGNFFAIKIEHYRFAVLFKTSFWIT